MSPAIVAIDGPAGAGKSTVARQLARRLGFSMIDTGAIYRSVALAARRAGVGWDDDEGLRKLLDKGLPISFVAEPEERVLLNGEDVTQAIRTPEISRGASVVSARPVVRGKLLGLQRSLGLQASKGAVLDGRDIGTAVCPDAAVKLFVTASPEARAARRLKELRERGAASIYGDVLEDMKERDARDSERRVAPLAAAPDAVIIDTTGLDADQVFERVSKLIARALAAHRN